MTAHSSPTDDDGDNVPGWADGVSVVLIIRKSECVRFRFRVRVRVRVFFLYLWRISFNFHSIFKLWQKVICF